MGDQVFFQGHAAPGIYARAFLEGRLDGDPAGPFPPGSRARRGPELVPAPAAHAGLLGVPLGVDGPLAARGHLPGPLQPLPAPPRHQGHIDNRVWAFLGDGETDEPESLGSLSIAARERPRQPDLRRQLQPAAPRRSGPRQRQDRPGARVGLPRRRLERHQGRSGAASGTSCSPATSTACWSTGWARCWTASRRSSRSRPAPTSASTSSARTRACWRWSRTSPTTRSRRSAAAATTTARSMRRTAPPLEHARPADRDPGPDGQGLDARPRRRGAQHHPPGQEAQRGGAEGLPRPARSCRSRTPSSRTRPTTSPADDSPEIQYLQERRRDARWPAAAPRGAPKTDRAARRPGLRASS